MTEAMGFVWILVLSLSSAWGKLHSVKGGGLFVCLFVKLWQDKKYEILGFWEVEDLLSMV